MKKVYLDYNIWQEMYKNEDTKKFFTSLSEYEYYLSVAHFEELFHARNNETEEYKGDSDRLKTLMLQLSKKGILKPSFNGITFYQDATEISSAIVAIEKQHNTQKIIKEFAINQHAGLCNDVTMNNIDGVKQEDLYKKIWEQETVKNQIVEFNERRTQILPLIQNNPEFASQLMSQQFLNEYTKNGISSELINIIIGNIISLSTEIQSNSFDSIKSNYQILENIIENLYYILDKTGFKRDKNERTAISGIYDTQHSIMSTYCDVFITKDKKFIERYKAVAWYLGIPIEILRWNGKELQ